MQIRLTNLEQLSLSEMEDLLSGSEKVTWEAKDIASKYAIIAAVLKAQSYRKLGKRERGIVRQFLAKVTAISRAQLTRLNQPVAERTEDCTQTGPTAEFHGPLRAVRHRAPSRHRCRA
jgi:hypothetical protein